jgi:hypothetical protein
MALNYITLVRDLADGTGTPLATSQALLAPPSLLTDDNRRHDRYPGAGHREVRRVEPAGADPRDL